MADDVTKPLAGRIALITGASRGIGAATALAIAKAGAHVIATARTTGGLEELDDAIQTAGGTATLVPLDMKDTDGLARLGMAVTERYRKLDILIGNAGILGSLSPLDHIEQKVWDDVMAVNVTANWQLLRIMGPLLKLSDAGRAVFVSSGAASNTHAYWGPYSASKAALDALVRTFANETEKTAVRANLFRPGQTRTRMHKTAFPGLDPMTFPSPEELAETIVPLCLPSFTETGKVYDFRKRALLSFQPPA